MARIGRNFATLSVALAAGLALTGCARETGAVRVSYVCGGDKPLEAVFSPNSKHVTLTFENQTMKLPLTDDTDGVKYSDKGYTFWSSGPGVGFVAKGQEIVLKNCQATEETMV